MADCTVQPGKIHGGIRIPASKSQSLRAILFAALAKGTSTIHNVLSSPDAEAMMRACTLLGAKIDQSGSTYTIQGIGSALQPPADIIDAGNSGIVLRFIAAIASLGSFPIVISGDASIRAQRPMQPLLDALSKLGVSARSTRNNGFAPLIIEGPIKGNRTTVPGEDSQPVSALLIMSGLVTHPIEIEVLNPGEKPWIDLTLHWLRSRGVTIENRDYTHYKVTGKQHFDGFDYTVPSDMSSAAFPVGAALATGSEITLEGFDDDQFQGDRRLFSILKEMGAHLEVSSNTHTMHVGKGQKLKGVTVDINDCIDCICILAVIACFAEGETRIVNAAIARTKECNRIQALHQELSKMGADITETPDGLIIRGGKPLKGAVLSSYHDHRTAMSMCIAAMGATGESTVQGIECMRKTYPTFIEDFIKIGARFKVSP